MIEDAVVLGLTLWKTSYIFGLDQETKNATKITMKMAYNGRFYLLLTSFFGLSAIGACARWYSIWVCFPLLGFGSLIKPSDSVSNAQHTPRSQYPFGSP